MARERDNLSGRFVKNDDNLPATNDQVVQVDYLAPQIKQAAALVLEYLSSLDPQWRIRIQVAQEERHWDKLQTLCQLAAYTLEQNAHLWIPPHPAFEADYHPTGSTALCPVCQKEFISRYPGQPFCSNSCAQVSRGEQSLMK